jgi:hypothetical protein
MKASDIKKKLDLYRLIEEAVQNGAAYGHRRAWKHFNYPDNGPSDDSAAETITRAVMDELSEIIDWES